MSKAEEVEACDKFMSEIVQFILPIEQRKFVLVDHAVSPEEFAITIGYNKSLNKSLFEHKINEFVYDITKEDQNSDLHRYHWAVHRSLCEDIEMPHSYFFHAIVITFSVL